MRVGIIGLGDRLGHLARVFSLASPDFEIVGYVDPAPSGLPYSEGRPLKIGFALPQVHLFDKDGITVA